MGCHFRFGAAVMLLLCGTLCPRRLAGNKCDAYGKQFNVDDIFVIAWGQRENDS
jgi:hypothetical protein